MKGDAHMQDEGIVRGIPHCLAAWGSVSF